MSHLQIHQEAKYSLSRSTYQEDKWTNNSSKCRLWPYAAEFPMALVVLTMELTGNALIKCVTEFIFKNPSGLAVTPRQNTHRRCKQSGFFLNRETCCRNYRTSCQATCVRAAKTHGWWTSLDVTQVIPGSRCMKKEKQAHEKQREGRPFLPISLEHPLLIKLVTEARKDEMFQAPTLQWWLHL